MGAKKPEPVEGHRRIEDKLGHIDAALDGKSEVGARAGRYGALTFEKLRFVPATLPEVNLSEIDLSVELAGKRIAAPLMVSPMTGGVKRAGELNLRMAAAAQRAGIAFGVGSQRVALEVPARAADFQVRAVAPTIPLFANLGAVQLVKGYGADEAWRAVEMIEADALYLHLNAMQEVVQEGGDTSWRGVLRAIGKVCDAFAKRRKTVPVFVREVGFGVPSDQAKRLVQAGVGGIDCSGGGGTSWTSIEGRVASHATSRALGETFADWGLSTPESILEVRRASKRIPLIASGGLRSGLDVAKALALGATVGGMAAPVLRAAEQGDAALDQLFATTIAELRATLFGVGAGSVAAFRRRPRLRTFA
ncbi:type 2 isopentenyl-diphosphate Delta-isomerase [Myxococcota bacterium]|nr:type 2 isopentenyl-diphosphate Delta-isomerase [Myxococcota bacterium]